jgi:glyoxylase-like metal-dependent hydrolase (beta-lactamase superfamily II)
LKGWGGRVRVWLMKPAENLREVVPGLWCWSALHEEWKVEFSSCAWKGEAGWVVIDPIELSASGLESLERAGRPVAVLLTNQNHEREAEVYRRRYGIKVHVHRDAVPGIELTPDEFFCDGSVLPGGLRVVHVPGACPSECVFYGEANGGMVLAGDIVVNGKGGLAFLPDDYCQDAAQSRVSARRLLELKFEVLTVAHGPPLFPGASGRFAGLFKG